MRGRAASAVPWLLAMALALACGGACSAAGPVDFTPSRMIKPQGPVLKHFVRIDMIGDAVSPGCAMAVPVQVRPLHVLDAVTADKYDNWYDAVPDGYELKNVHGRWQLFSDDRDRPDPAWECVLGQAQEPFIKALLRGANPSAYGDLDLGNKLHVLGTCAWGIEGNDLSSALRLPFQVAPSATISADYAILFVNEWEGPDTGKLTVKGAEAAMVQRMCDMGLAPQVRAKYEGDYQVNSYKRRLHSAGGATGSQGSDADRQSLYNLTLQDMWDGTFKDDGAPALTMSLPFTTSLTHTVSLTACTAGPLTTEGAPPFRLVYWHKSDARGFMTYSSFSEPGHGKHKGETWIYLTPLSMIDIGYTTLALKRETVRAWRTHWLLKNCQDSAGDVTGVAAELRPFMQEALLRATLPLWEHLAVGNALGALQWFNNFNYLSGPALGRLSNNGADTLALLIRPPEVPSDQIGMDDFHAPSYLKVCDAPADHRYARAVYLGWKTWKETQPAKLRPVVEAVAQAVQTGYCRDWSSMDPTYLATSYFNVATASAVTTYGDGLTLARFKPAYGDLEWVAQAILPETAPNTPVATAVIDACPLAPLLFPFRGLHKLPEGRQIARFVRGPGLQAIEGLPLTTSDAFLKVLVTDDDSMNQVRALCTGQFANEGTKISTAYTYVTTWMSDATERARRPGEMEARLASGATPAPTDAQKTEARAFLKLYYRAQLNDLLKNDGPFSKLAADRRVGSFDLVKPAGTNKVTTLLPVWPSAPQGSQTTDTPTALFDQAVTTVLKFIDYVAYAQTMSPSQTNSAARKEKFLQSLITRCMLKPAEVWPKLYLKYVEAASRREFEDWKEPAVLLQRVTSAGQSMGRVVRFKLKAGGYWAPVGR